MHFHLALLALITAAASGFNTNLLRRDNTTGRPPPPYYSEDLDIGALFTETRNFTIGNFTDKPYSKYFPIKWENHILQNGSCIPLTSAFSRYFILNLTSSMCCMYMKENCQPWVKGTDAKALSPAFWSGLSIKYWWVDETVRSMRCRPAEFGEDEFMKTECQLRDEE